MKINKITMKSTKMAFLVLGIAAIILSGMMIFSFCSSQPHNENVILQIAGSYSIPGMRDSDLKGSSQIEILERDSYGRILYSYSCYNVITEKDEIAIAICQKSDQDYVYFYEDICYIIGEYDDSYIDALKSANDWESPYNDGKMSRRRIKYTLDGYIVTDHNHKFKPVKSAFADALGIEESSFYDHCIIDYDGNGLAVYFFAINNEDGTKNQYYVISSDSYEISYIKISNIDDIVSFKKENGWKYGY